MLKCSTPTLYNYITGSTQHLSAEKLWFWLFFCDTPWRSVTLTQQMQLWVILWFLSWSYKTWGLLVPVLLLNSKCQYPYGHVLMSKQLRNNLSYLSPRLAVMWGHTLYLFEIRSCCLLWKPPELICQPWIWQSILDVLYLSWHGGFLLISPCANTTSLAVWMYDGIQRAIITDRLRSRYQAPTGDVQ